MNPEHVNACRVGTFVRGGNPEPEPQAVEAVEEVRGSERMGGMGLQEARAGLQEAVVREGRRVAAVWRLLITRLRVWAKGLKRPEILEGPGPRPGAALQEELDRRESRLEEAMRQEADFVSGYTHCCYQLKCDHPPVTLRSYGTFHCRCSDTVGPFGPHKLGCRRDPERQRMYIGGYDRDMVINDEVAFLEERRRKNVHPHHTENDGE